MTLPPSGNDSDDYPEKPAAADSVASSAPSSPVPSGVVHLASDLLLTSRVAQFCRARQIPYRVVSRCETLATSAIPPDVMIIDLQAPGWNAESFRMICQANLLPHRVIAYAQHVEAGLLESAAELGIETVMTRGAFDARFPQLLA